MKFKLNSNNYGIQNLNCGSTFTDSILAAHNTRRLLHQSPALSLNSTLNAIAQEYSNFMAKNNIYQNSNNQYGENLYYSGSSKLESCDGE